MLKNFLIGFTVILVAFLVAGYTVFSHSGGGPLASPLNGISKLKFSDNLWLPKVGTVLGDEKPPEITAKAAFFVDTHTGKVLFDKNSHDRLQIASLTKIMTVIVTLENKKLTD